MKKVLKLTAILIACLASIAAYAGGTKEGIKIHGHWTIEVRNPDGTLVEHREFENALTDLGARELALFLARKNLVGNWEIDLDASNGIRPCDNRGVQDQCRVVERFLVVLIGHDPNEFVNLEVSTAPPPNVIDHPNAVALSLYGTAIAANNSSINQVATSVWACAVSPNPVLTVPPACFPPSQRDLFTSARLPVPVNVVPHQIIQVMVVISFS